MKDPRPLVVVTGTTGGLGSAIARDLLGAGYRVVGVARRLHHQLTDDANEGSYSHVSWDLGEIETLKDLCDTIFAEFGRPYGLVNNAAVGTSGLLPTMHNRDITDVIRVNLTSPIVITKFLIRPMLERRDGRIVNISSIVAGTGYRGLAAYAASKAGLEGFTHSLARDVGSRGVTVNAVAPGFLETDMTSVLGSDDMDRIRARSALKRFATTNEVAATVRYLMSREAAGITGTTVTVDAGSTA